MKLHRFHDAKAFYEQARPYLLQHEAEHNLILGISRALIRNPERFSNPPYLAIVEAAAEIIAIALRTPPRPLVLSKVKDLAALEPIANDLYDLYNDLYAEPYAEQNPEQPLSGVSGLPEESSAFAHLWQALTQRPYHLDEQRYIYQLTQVQPVPKARGNLRVATDRDRTLLLQWLEAFELEALGADEADTEQMLDNGLKQEVFHLWEDEHPVTVVGASGTAPDGGRIAPVYTPPEYRRKGYATSCVAAVSQQLLDRGCRCCFLFADQANSTSNHIYQTIGYELICEWHEYSFGNGK